MAHRLAWTTRTARTTLFLCVSLSIGAGATMLACGGSDTGTLFTGDASTAGDGSSSSGDGGGTTGDGGSTTNDGGGGKDGGGGDSGGQNAQCGQQTTARACSNCCAGLYPQGAQVAQQAEIQCACGPTKCLTVCGTNLCQGHQATTECASCVAATLNSADGGCIAEVQAACNASAQCQQYEACATSECAGKP